MSKITVETKQFDNALTFVNKMLDAKPLMPELAYVLIEAEGEMLRLSTSNGSNSVSTFITLKNAAKEPFAVCIHAKKLLDIVKLLEQDQLTISKAETRVTLIAGTGKYGFSIYPKAVEALKPITYMAVDGVPFTINAEKFTQAVSTASIFAANDETTKFTLMGVMVKALDNQILASAMDGKRAAEVMIPDDAAGRNESVFIPGSGISVLSDLMDGKDLAITRGDTAIRFESGSRVAVIRRSSSENLPEITNFINKYLEKEEVVANVEAALVTSCVKRLQTAVEGKMRKIMFEVTADGLKLNSLDAMTSCQEFEETLVADTKGTGKFSLNASNILDYTKTSTGLITFRFAPSQPNAAVVLTNTSGCRCMISVVK